MGILFPSCSILSTCFSFSLFLFFLPDICTCTIFWESQNKRKPSMVFLVFRKDEKLCIFCLCNPIIPKDVFRTLSRIFLQKYLPVLNRLLFSQNVPSWMADRVVITPLKKSFKVNLFVYKITCILLPVKVKRVKNLLKISQKSTTIPHKEFNRSNDANQFLGELVSEALFTDNSFLLFNVRHYSATPRSSIYL